MKRQTWSFAPALDLGKGSGERRPQPSLRCSLASSPSSPSSRRAKQRTPKASGPVQRGEGEVTYATRKSHGSLASSSESLRPDPCAGFSRRPFVFGTAGGSPPRTAARPSKPPALRSSTIPRCRFHTAFVQTPEETDSTESLLQGQSDSKLQIRSLPSFDAQSGYGCEVRNRESIANRQQQG
ncbi:hypothetical protein PAL_GLEAN10016655 [Pteropus alecto]|uniref:Uncharacterized protein n=1 Tax=Pteropus alecto TaxID=9402 RepID=L5L1D7_PTEAL|nr:hypothetical protein PAL_GLEAN10016655 [Pteropus alecto]